MTNPLKLVFDDSGFNTGRFGVDKDTNVSSIFLPPDDEKASEATLMETFQDVHGRWSMFQNCRNERITTAP